MLKKALKMLYLIPAYIVLTVLQNLKTLFIKSNSNINILSNINYMNLQIFISLLFIFFVLLFYKKIKKYKLTINSIFIVIFSCNLLNGVFVGRNLGNFIFIYLYLLFLTYFVTYIFRQNFEISIFISTSFLLILMYVLALFNLLVVVKYLIILSILVSIIYISKLLLNKNDQKNTESKERLYLTINKFNRATLFIFSLFFVIFIIGGINRYVSIWDEYSHWAFDAKAVIHFDRLTTCEQVMSRTRNYPPILSLWHYFISIFMNGFNEENLYVGICLFTLIFLMPALSVIDKKRNIFKILISISLIFCCYLIGGVYSYGSLYADLPFTIVFSNCFVIYVLFNQDTKLFEKLLTLNLIILILTKPTGFILASVFVLILMINDYIKYTNHSFKEKIKYVIKKSLKLILLVILTVAIWYVYIKLMNILNKDYYSYILIPPSLSTTLSSKLDILVIARVFKSLLKAFNETTINIIVPLNLYQYIILIFSLLFIVFYYGNNKSSKQAFNKLLPIFIGYIVHFVLMILAIFVSFSLYEVENLASFVRYLDSFNLALIVLLLVYICSDKFYIEKNKIIAIILITSFVIFIPYKGVGFVAFDHLDKVKAKEFSQKMDKKFEIVRNNTNENDLIYVLDQNDKDGIMAMWYARYYLFPRKTNASQKAINWKILTDINGDDLGGWGLSATTLAQNLYDYNFNYLYLYSYDNYMYDEMKYLFTDYSKAKNCSLFKVEKNINNSKVKLVPVI